MKKLPVKKDIEQQENYKLQRLKHTVECVVTESLYKEAIEGNQPEVEIITDMLSANIIFRFSNRFASKNAGYFEFKWYSSWWQELRDKILPNWYLRKYPSKWEVKRKSQAIVVYPTIKIEDEIHYPIITWS